VAAAWIPSRDESAPIPQAKASPMRPVLWILAIGLLAAMAIGFLSRVLSITPS
jgi:hypothetical protein